MWQRGIPECPVNDPSTYPLTPLELHQQRLGLALLIFLLPTTAHSCFLPEPATCASPWVEKLLPFNMTDFSLGELSAILSHLEV